MVIQVHEITTSAIITNPRNVPTTMIHELEITMSCITMFVVMGEVTVAISE